MADLPGQRSTTNVRLSEFRNLMQMHEDSTMDLREAMRAANLALADLDSIHAKVSALEVKGAELFACYTATIETLLRMASKGYL